MILPTLSAGSILLLNEVWGLKTQNIINHNLSVFTVL